MTDAAKVGIAWSPRGGRAQRATGSSLKAGQILQLTWARLPRSLRAFAQNDQQKTGPVYFNLALTRAREASGGNNRERPARSAGAGGVGLRRRSAGGIFVLVKCRWSTDCCPEIRATMELGR